MIMKRDLWLLAVALVATLVIVAYIQLNSGEDENRYSFEENGDTVTVTGILKCYDSNVVIPSMIKGKEVVAIDSDAFAGNKMITSVAIPKTVTKLGDGAFRDCKNLSEITYDGVAIYLINGKIGDPECTLEYGSDCFKGARIFNIEFGDSNDNDSIVPITFSNVPDKISKVVVDAQLTPESGLKSSTEISITDRTSQTENVDFRTYGLFEDVKVTTYAGPKQDRSIIIGDVKVTAEHYNFAYISATYPVLLFSLQLCHNDGPDDSLSNDPTFVLLERKEAFDWDKLPSNVSYMPFLSKQDGTTTGGFHTMREPTAEYIKQLHELNEDSTFSLYCGDNYSELILQMLVANQIPEDHWEAHLLTDGSGTAGHLNRIYGIADPDAKYETLASDWHNVKQAVYENGFSIEFVKSYLSETSGVYSILRCYSYVIAKEQPNVDWTTGRLRATENLYNVPPEFVTKILAVAKVVYTNNLLAALTEEEGVTFKDMYHFSDEMFSVARDQDKKIMVILGTGGAQEGIIDVEGEVSKFYYFVKTTMDFYGDDYVYYYKGHPGYPTSMYEHRQEAMDALVDKGYPLYELDNSIAAEVIMFFNPDIYLSGWRTTTFESVEEQSMACALFDCRKGSVTDVYIDDMDMFFNIISGTSFENIPLDSGKSYCLIEFNNNPDYESQMEVYNKHEIAIYNLTDDVLKFYKWNGDLGEYEEVAE